MTARCVLCVWLRGRGEGGTGWDAVRAPALSLDSCPRHRRRCECTRAAAVFLLFCLLFAFSNVLFVRCRPQWRFAAVPQMFVGTPVSSCLPPVFFCRGLLAHDRLSSVLLSSFARVCAASRVRSRLCGHGLLSSFSTHLIRLPLSCLQWCCLFVFPSPRVIFKVLRLL